MKHLRFRIYGKVQGVSFRASTKAVADQLGVKGVVLNEADGSVYAEAEGDHFALEAFREWCEEGPQDAIVDRVEMEEIPELKNYRNFEVLKRMYT